VHRGEHHARRGGHGICRCAGRHWHGSQHIPREAGTTTIESKTNFISAAREGTTIHAESTPIHIGRKTCVWQTRITREDGKLVAIVTQTQMVLLP
jgi:1,4-dihydroxy-2-naphthoyl-CoA hydrolase